MLGRENPGLLVAYCPQVLAVITLVVVISRHISSVSWMDLGRVIVFAERSLL